MYKTGRKRVIPHRYPILSQINQLLTLNMDSHITHFAAFLLLVSPCENTTEQFKCPCAGYLDPLRGIQKS